MRFVPLAVAALLSLVLAACAGGAPDLYSSAGLNASRAAASGGITNGGSVTAASAGGGGSRYRGELRIVRTLPVPKRSASGGLTLAPNDLLEVKFFGIEKLDRTARIDADGMISLPLIGSVKAAGKTVAQLEKELERRYAASYLQNPDITINVKESFARRVTVNGEVKRPGIYPIPPRITLLQALSLAQGLSKVADPSKVFVFRDIDGVKYVAQYDVDAIRMGRRPDPMIFAGDIVVAFPSSAKVAMENLRGVLGLATSAGSLITMFP